MIKIVDGRWGRCEYFAKDEYVGKSMHYYGEYNPDETEKIIELAGDGLCLDIGANIGVITQALLASGKNVIAFEPQPQVFELLSRNVAAVVNVPGSGKGCIYNCAVGDAYGIAKMPKVHYSERGNFGGLGIGMGSILGSIEVNVMPIDSMLNDLEKVSFIKLDVEGYEYEALCGMRGLIERDKPILYVEDDRAEKSARLRWLIRDLGYTIEDHRPLLYREQNFKGLKKNVWDKLYASHNIICRPC